MIPRHAAALLCGAAAVHLADFVCGLPGPGEGRTLLVGLGALPALVVVMVSWDRAVGLWAFLLGAACAYAAGEWLLIPSIGWTWSTALWVLPAGVSLFLRRKAAAPPETRSAPALLALAAGAVVLGLAIGFSFAFVRPFLFQHVTGTRHGVRIAVLTGLVGLLAGAALGGALKGRLPRWALATLGSAFALVSAATTFLLLPKASAGLVLPLFSGPWAQTWWGRSLAASWAVLGLLTVAFGMLLVLLDRRPLVPFLLAGLWAGTWGAEAAIRRLDSDPAACRAIADRVARHPPLQPIEAASIDPDGLWTRYRTRTLLSIESVGFWQATRFERGELWANLERAEVEATFGQAPSIRGHVAGELQLWRDDGRRVGRNNFYFQRPLDRVLTSSGYLASGLASRDNLGSLARERDFAQACLRVWCDPRALTPDGVRSILATWREALPSGRFLILIDGYSGPLLGIRAGGEGARFPVTEHLAVFEAPVAGAFRGELGPVSTWMCPILEWEGAPEPSPFIHPRADVMRALATALAIERGSALDALFRGLVIHAEAQVVRPYVVSSWDHVTIPESEVEAYMEGFRRDESSAILLRHLQIVFDVLYKKREYAMLVKYAEEAVARRPDAFGFHRTLGKAYHDILDHRNAVEELTLAHGLDPAHHDVVMELSRALGAAGKWPEAVALLEAERARSDDPAVLKGLSIALLESGDLGRAAPMLRELNTLYPGDLDLMRAIDRLPREGK